MAVYLGISTGDGTADSYTPTIYGNRFQCGTTGTLTTIELSVADTSVAGGVRLGIYADSSNYPGALILDAGAVTVVNGWTKATGLSVPVTSGTWYWLAYVIDDSPLTTNVLSGQPSNSRRYTDHDYGPLEDPFPAAADGSTSQKVMRGEITVAATGFSNDMVLVFES